MTTPRNCLYCKHLSVFEGCPGYGEYTPGYPMTMGCDKKRWELDECNVSRQSLAKDLARAEGCSDFLPDDDTPASRKD